MTQYLSSKPVRGKSSIIEANNFAWQIAHIKLSILQSAYGRVGSYISDWESVARKVMSAYYPSGSYPSQEEKKMMTELIEEIGFD